MKIISLTGTHSVGKTTLLNSLFNCLSGTYEVKIVPEAARLLIDKGFKMNFEITEYGILNFARYYLHQFRIQNADYLISDRSIIDLYAYISVNKNPKVRSEIIKLIEEIVFLEKERIHYYFYMPIEFSMENDSVRPSDNAYRMEVDLKIKESFSIFGIRYYELKGSLEERVTKALEILNYEN